MKSKNFLKPTGAALVLGSSLASLVGQQSVNANLLGSIKNFLFSSKTKNKEKKLSLKERKEKFNIKNQNFFSITQTSEEEFVNTNQKPEEVVFIATVSTIFLYRFFSYINLMHDAMNNIYISSVSGAIIDSTSRKIAGIGLLAFIGVKIFGIIRDKKLKKEYSKLKKFINEDKLEKQWKFEKFKEMAEKDDGESKRFLEQLLVLEPSSSENKDEDVPLLDKDNLNEKVQAFKDLFTKEPEELKSVKETDKKRIYKELINSLFYWCSGRMERLYDPGKKTEYEKNYFIAQDDIELASRIILLRKIVLGEKVDYQLKITNLTVKDFNKNIKDENMENFRKLLLHDIRAYINELDANDETIIKILTELTEPNEVGRRIDYYKKIKTLLDEEFKDKQKQNRVLLGLKNFFKEERHFRRFSEEVYESFKREMKGG